MKWCWAYHPECRPNFEDILGALQTGVLPLIVEDSEEHDIPPPSTPAPVLGLDEPPSTPAPVFNSAELIADGRSIASKDRLSPNVGPVRADASSTTPLMSSQNSSVGHLQGDHYYLQPVDNFPPEQLDLPAEDPDYFDTPLTNIGPIVAGDQRPGSAEDLDLPEEYISDEDLSPPPGPAPILPTIQRTQTV